MMLLHTKSLSIVFILFLIIPITFSESKRRLKRRVVFVKDSKFFIRINDQVPLFRWSSVFAHGWGFKTTWDLPTTLSNRKGFFKRSLQTHHDLLKESHSNNYYYGCILWLICHQIKSVLAQKSCGVICQLNILIQRHSSFNLSTLADNYCDFIIISPESCYRVLNN